MTLGESPPLSEREVAIIRGLLAEQHRQRHSAKNASADRHVRDALSDEMRTIEEISRKVGSLL